MATTCRNCPLRRRDFFHDLTADELAFMEKFKSGELVVQPGTPILMEGANSPQLYTVLSGMGLRYKTLENGDRHVVNLLFPGDFVGLQAGVMGEMKHSVEATTHMTLCVFDRAGLWTLFRQQPERAFDLTWLAAFEEHFLGEALATIGQQSAVQRVAWAVLRIFRRCRALGMNQGNMMRFPYRQQDLADLLGLSLVHTNKTLAEMRKRQVFSWQTGELHILDEPAMEDLSGLDVEVENKRPLI